MSQTEPAPATVSILPPLESTSAPSPALMAGQNLRTALGGLLAHKLRSALTGLGIVVGVAALLLVLQIGAISQQYVTAEYDHVGANSVWISLAIQPGTSKADAVSHSPLTAEDVLAVQKLPHVRVASPDAMAPFPASAGGRGGTLAVDGVYPAIQSLQNLSVAKGVFFTEQDEASGAAVAVIGSRFAQTRFPDVDPLGQELRIGSVNFRVVGVLAATSSVPDDPTDDSVYVPFSTFQQRLGRINPPVVMVQVDDHANVAAVIAAINQTLDQRHHIAAGQPRDFVVMDNSAGADDNVQMLQTMRLVMSLIGFVALLVGGFGVGSTMFMAVRQRTREIGVRVAVGARQSDILRQFLTEGAALSVIGGVVGLIVGTAAIFAFYVAYRNALLGHDFRDAVQAHMLPSPAILAIAIAVPIVIGMVFSYLPARRAATMDPVRALRDE